MTSFITATATSETYTLSLHDALPIFEPELTAEAGLLVAAERDPGERRVRHVDPDRARLDPPREPVPAGGIARPHGRHQPVAHVVRDPDRVLLVLEGNHGHDRPEDLLLRDLHPTVDLRQHRRRVERALAFGRFAAGDDFRAFIAPALDVAVDPLPVLLRDQRADLRLRVERIADPELLGRLAELRHELVVSGLLHEHA